MKANAVIYNDNIATMKAVNAGEVDGGVIYHYYWFRDQANTKESSGNTALHYFKNQDPGAFVSLSGGGVLKSSDKKDQAQQFLKFITGKAGQEVLEKGTSFEYPVASGVPGQSRPAAAGFTAGARGGPVDAERAEGDGSDDEGGLAVGGRSSRFATCGRQFRGLRRPSAPARWSPPRSRSWSPQRSSRSATWCGARCRSDGRAPTHLVVRPRVGELLVNTVGLVVVTVPLCVVIGVGVAWLVERTDLPGRAFWRPLFVAPLAIPAFVNSYAWVGVIPSLHGLWAGVLVATLSYFPFMYLPVAATLRRLDPAVEESARALGSDSVGVFFRVVLPQLRLAILGGGLLIGVHLLAEYGAFAMMRFDTFTIAIFQQFQVTFDGAAGSMLAGVLVLLCWCC